MQRSKRIETVSFIAIIMVVYLHAYNIRPNSPVIDSLIQNFLTNGLARSAVPLFFTLSGFLFFFNLQPTVTSFLSKLKKRIFTLFSPYLAWKITILFILLLAHSIFYISNCRISFFYDYSFIHFLHFLYNDPFLYQFWFLRDLMIFVLLSPIFYLLLRYLDWVGLTALFLIWFLDLRFPHFPGVLFFLLGAYLGLKKFDLDKPIPYSKIIVILWLSLALFSAYLMAFHGLGYDNYIYKTVFHKGMVLLGVISLWILADYGTAFLEKHSFDFLTDFSFFLYAAHEPLTSRVIYPFLRKIIGPEQWTGLLVYLLGPILVISLVICLGFFLRKYLVWFYNLLTGGR